MTIPSGVPLHFLVVDDDHEARATAVEYLKALGFERISQAVDGREALRLLERDQTINFVISDWDMPNVDGLSLLQEVRMNPMRAEMPFLIMTSPVSQEAEKIVLAAENLVNAYIIKPFRSELLKEKIGRLLEMSVHGPQKRAVVVDDDEDARATVVEYLRALGFKDIQALPDGKSALKYIEENRNDIGLIISDWEMPEMSGIELLRACKSNDELVDIPFLMITSQGSMERMKVLQAAKANVDKYLLKPFMAGDLKTRIDELMQSYRYRKEVTVLVAEGLEHLEYGRYAKAQAVFERVLRMDMCNEGALVGMGDTMMRMKGVETAQIYYKKAVESHPMSARSCLKLVAAYEQIGWIEKAVMLLEDANRRISFSAELHFHLGRLYNKRGDVVRAKTEFEKALEIQLDYQEARLMLEMLASRKQSGGESGP
ncbi:MAG: hypothetical protein A2583_09455 [Bdellovibrionales bacterium RIFOXYD1_FULL_53_11]|nr:MAG: hypothetical protein A2583_09455 [Bdellovibrionales bacterium RIFOXYD1_FULL_53_11]